MSDQKEIDPSWEKATIQKLLFETLKEQRRARRWRIFFRLVLLSIIAFILVALFSSNSNLSKPHTALIKVNGLIMDNGKSSAENLLKGITRAFKDKNTKGIILQINSPGGTPVQADQIFEGIAALKKEYPDTKVYAVCSDICASGAYYVAAATDEIYANKASLVGSIGVLMNGFGFVDTLQKVGAERRLMTSGDKKAMLDPFSPLKQGEVDYMQTVLDDVHQLFIDRVKEGRGTRLQNNPDLFSGLVWTGDKALGLGLIDGFGDTHYIANSVIGQKDIVDFTERGSVFEKFNRNLSTTFFHDLQTHVASIDMR